MEFTIITCDICGAPIGMKGGSIDLHAHDVAKTVLTMYPLKRVGVYDLCEECRDELAAWIRKRKEESSSLRTIEED